MTVQELIEELKDMDKDMKVEFSYNSGDHWNTQVAQDIREVEEVDVAFSSYHNADKVLDDGVDTTSGTEDGEEIKTVVLLSSGRF